MNREKIHQKVDAILDTSENIVNAVKSKFNLITAKYKADRMAKDMGYAALYAHIQQKLDNDVDLTELELLIYNEIELKINQ